MKQIITVGTAGPIDEALFLQDATSSSGAGLTGLSYNTGGLSCYYKRNNGTASVPVALVNIGTLGSYVSGGFQQIDATNMPGLYEFHPPAAAFASGATSVTFYFQGAANLVPRPIQYEISAVNLQDGTRGGLAALPNVASGAAGGVLVQGTGTTGLNVSGGSAPATLASGDFTSTMKTSLNNATPTVALAATQPNYAPAKAGAQMDLVNAPNATAVAAFQNGLATLAALTTLQSHGDATWSTATGFASSSQATAILSALNNLKNLTALANLFGPSTMVPPASGSQAYLFALTVNDNEGNPVDTDATPTITATNLAGSSMSGRLSAISSVATGLYGFTYTVDASDLGSNLADEISFAASATYQTAQRNALLKVALVPAEQLTAMASMLSILQQFAFDSQNYVKANMTAATAGVQVAGYASGQAPPSAAAVAAAILANPAQPLATDSSGNVAANNLPGDYQQRGVAVTLPANPPGGFLEAASYGTAPSWYTAQSGDAFARLGSPAGASIAADIAGVAGSAAAAADALGTAGSGLTSLPPVTLSTACDLYLADINLTRNSTTGTDEYTVVWSKNGVALSSGVSAARIQVNNQDGSSLIASTAMIGPSGTGFYHNETANLVTAGSPVDVIVTATIDGQTRSFSRLTGRDA